MITVVLAGLGLWFGFEIGRRYSAGKLEEEQDIQEERRSARGRSGTLTLKPMRVRR